MKAKIDTKGLLHIERKGKWRVQHCPFEAGSDHCGDWCPLFEDSTDSERGISFVRLSCAPEGVLHDIVSDERAG